VVSGSGAEALAVTEIRGRGIGLDMVVLSASSAKPICRVTDLAPDYHCASACNGFLLLTSDDGKWPVFVCNPITGEKLKIPVPRKIKITFCETYAMGFSPSTRQYKVFRLASEKPVYWEETLYSYLDVYTLGDDAGSWRQHPQMFLNRALYDHYSPPPALVDGKLYVLTERRDREVPHMMLVINVASEAHYTYRLPLLEEFTREVEAEVHLFEMWGRLYVAVHFIGQHLLHFWVMPPWTNDGMLHVRWELCYTFYVDDDDIRKSHLRKRSPWHDARDGMLCYRLGDCLYKYNTTKDDQRKKKKQAGGFSEWDHRIQLPVAPLPTKQRCNFYGGYRYQRRQRARPI
jgi:F-box interacting protein